MTADDMYDVVVIGGGAAGLSGALALGRSRRSVVVIDAGEPRNAPADHAHNYLGREGVPPLELLGTGRAEVAAYGVEVLADRVVALSGATDDFLVTTLGGRRHRARRVLHTGGVVDELPDVPGLAERWGTDVLHCPYCHGWEVRDRAIAVLATGPTAAHQALLFRQLSDDVVLVVHDGVGLADEDAERLGAIGVRLLHGTPREVVTSDSGALLGLRLADGSVLERDAIVVAPKPHVRADHLAQAGIDPTPFEMHGAVLGSVIAVEPTGATSVPGVFAAGNATDLSMTLMASAAHGNRVGAWINAELAAADADRAVRERRDGFFESPAWEERYSGERVWSGRVNVQLAAEAPSLAPGRALDIGCGEGGDAIWLAQQGWQVTAVDFAEAALARTAGHAAEAGVGDRVEIRRVDVRTFEPDGEQWDLVTSHFFHLPDGGMPDVVQRLASAVAPGGTLLVVGHAPDDLHTGLRHGHVSFMFTADQLVPALPDDFEVEVCESRPRTQPHPETGEEIAVADAVLRARRRPERGAGGCPQMSPQGCRGGVRVATIERMIISGDLDLDRAAHEAASATLSARLAELDERRRAAEGCVDALLSSWRGAAAGHFASRWQEWDGAACDVVDALSALLGAVDIARSDLLATDAGLAARTSELAGRLG